MSTRLTATATLHSVAFHTDTARARERHILLLVNHCLTSIVPTTHTKSNRPREAPLTSWAAQRPQFPIPNPAPPAGGQNGDPKTDTIDVS